MLLRPGALGIKAGGQINALAASLRASDMTMPPHNLSPAPIPPKYKTCAKDRDSTHGLVSEKFSMNSYKKMKI